MGTYMEEIDRLATARAGRAADQVQRADAVAYVRRMVARMARIEGARVPTKCAQLVRDAEAGCMSHDDSLLLAALAVALLREASA